MGLDTSHGCWHGAYSAFMRWRNTVAQAAGYPMIRTIYGLEYKLDWDGITEDNLLGIWEKTPDDPLLVLLAHSDCDGEIRPEQAGPLADRLEEILPKIQDGGGGHIAVRGGMVEVTKKFIEGLRTAAQVGEAVDFH